jgi:AraC-like DNA-binding protein
MLLRSAQASAEPQVEDPSQRKGGVWAETLATIFGPHTLEAAAQCSGTGDVASGGGGLLRYWRMAHGPLRLVAGREKRSRDTLKTGTFLLLIVEQGEAEVEFFSHAVHLQAGDALLLTAIEPLVFSTSSPFAGAWIELPIWWLVELFGGGLVGARSKLDGGLVSTRTLLSVFEQLRGREVDDRDVVDLFGDVLKRCLLIAGRGTEEEAGQIRRIAIFIAGNYRQEGLSPSDAALALGCSVSSIHKCCAAAGSTFGTMLASMRLSVAAYRLARDPHRISDIAFDCGFASVSHFCHAFKAYHGVTPKSMRSRHSR